LSNRAGVQGSATVGLMFERDMPLATFNFADPPLQAAPLER
jgi:hypothetical protein